MKYCDFSKAKAGDKVWSYKYGWLTIRSINCPLFLEYPIEAVTNSGLRTSYTVEGKAHISDIHPTLFWNEFEIPEEAFEKPLPSLEVDTLVWVWNNYETNKVLRFFSHFDDGYIYAFIDGRDSSYNPDNTIRWNYWELYEPKIKD